VLLEMVLLEMGVRLWSLPSQLLPASFAAFTRTPASSSVSCAASTRLLTAVESGARVGGPAARPARAAPVWGCRDLAKASQERSGRQKGGRAKAVGTLVRKAEAAAALEAAVHMEPLSAQVQQTIEQTMQQAMQQTIDDTPAGYADAQSSSRLAAMLR
jgi:hypothetical protein